MHIRKAGPDPRLTPDIQHYQERIADLGNHMVRRPLPARTDVFMEFYFTRPHTVELTRSGAMESAPWGVAVGPQTFRRVDLLLSERLDVFTVSFRPGGLHRLFGIPMTALTDQAIETANLFGGQQARDLQDRLFAAGSFASRCGIMDRILLPRAQAARSDTAVLAAFRLQRSAGQARLQDLVAASGLSERQFRRNFETRIGMPAKLYARILRFNKALEAKTATPSLSWTEIAHRFGWFDHAHLDKDFQELAGDSPSGFMKMLFR